MVDEEVKRLIETAHDEAWQILVDNRDILDELVLELLEKETLDKAAGRRDLHRDPQAAGPAGVDRLRQAQSAGRPGHDAEGARPRPPGSTGRTRSTAWASRARPTCPTPRFPPTTSRAGRWGRRADTGRRASGRPARRARVHLRRGAVRRATSTCWSPSARTPTATGLRRHAGAGRPRLPRDLRRSLAGARGRAHDDVRPRPRRDGAGQGHRGRTRSASTTSCRSPASRTSATSRRTTAASPGCPSSARLVDVFARRPQVQERMTTQIADALMRILEPRGVIVVIECEHLCMSMRGIRKPGARR